MTSIVHGQLVAIVGGVVLDKGVDGCSSGREIRNHVGLANDDLSIQDVVVGVVAAIHHEGEVDDHSRGVALAVGAGIGLVGRQSVVGQKLVVAQPIHDDASAGTLHFRSEVNPAACHVKCLILKRVWVNREVERGFGPIRILGIAFASLQGKQQSDCAKKGKNFVFHYAKRTLFLQKTYVLDENCYFCPSNKTP